MTDPRLVHRLGAAITLVVTALAATLLVLRGILPLHEASHEIVSLEQARRILADAGSPVEALEASVADERLVLAALETGLPVDVDLDAFLASVEAEASASGVRVRRLSPGRPVAHPRFREQEVMLELSGPFPRIYDTVRELERTAPHARVRTLRVVGGPPRAECDAVIRLVLTTSPEVAS